MLLICIYRAFCSFKRANLIFDRWYGVICLHLFLLPFALRRHTWGNWGLGQRWAQRWEQRTGLKFYFIREGNEFMFFVHLRNPGEWRHPGGGKGEMVELKSLPGELKTSFVSRKIASPFRVPCKWRRQRSPCRQLLPRPILRSASGLSREEERLFPLLPRSRPSWNCGLSAPLPPASCSRGYWTASTSTALPPQLVATELLPSHVLEGVSLPSPCHLPPPTPVGILSSIQLYSEKLKGKKFSVTHYPRTQRHHFDIFSSSFIMPLFVCFSFL